MSIQRVLVLEAQVPFVHGGAEILVRQLTSTLKKQGYDAEIVSIPFRDHPHDQLMAHAIVWRLLDLTFALNKSIDLVIGTKFPTYFVRHPTKIAWLAHQHRAAYELCGTSFSNFSNTESDVGLRDRLVKLDTQTLAECRGLFSIAKNVSRRLKKYNGLIAKPLYHPPKLAEQLKGGKAKDYVLTVTRLEKVKRVDLIINAFTKVDPGVRLVVAGTGTEHQELASQIEACGLKDRITLLGHVSDEELIRLYADALAVIFTPFDEDYGYVTLEAFLARKPVITTSDSGGVLEFVSNDKTGLVTEPVPEALADAINQLASNRGLASELGAAGFEVARMITWDGVVDTLVGAV